MNAARHWRPALLLATLAGMLLLAVGAPPEEPARPTGARAVTRAVARPGLPAPAARPSDQHDAALSALDTGLVARRTTAGGQPGGKAPDAFAAHSWTVVPPPAPPAPVVWQPPPEPPPPQAPPLPFKYLGRLEESPERTVWYLLQGERLIVKASGEPIDSSYRIDGAEAGQLRFTYLPLGQQQTLTLPIGAPP
jgi:hypothetical protein